MDTPVPKVLGPVWPGCACGLPMRDRRAWAWNFGAVTFDLGNMTLTLYFFMVMDPPLAGSLLTWSGFLVNSGSIGGREMEFDLFYGRTGGEYNDLIFVAICKAFEMQCNYFLWNGTAC